MYDITEYYNAKTIDEAIGFLCAHPEATIICGGSDVLIRIREGKMAGASLVSIRDIQELYGVSLRENGDICIGAATPFSHITADPIISERIPVLGEAVDQVGGPQIRNIGTIGGNICNGAVSADSAPTVFSLEAELEIANKDGGRRVPVSEFYLGPGRVDLHPGDLLTHIVIHREKYEGYRGHYIKYAMRRAMDIATLSCSAVCKVENGILTDIRITFGVAAPTPLRCHATEDSVRGMKVGDELYEAVSAGVRSEINPRDSWRASKAFRLQIGGEIAKRAVRTAIEGGHDGKENG